MFLCSLRIYPHQQNTGGFFVAVFDKVRPLTAADRVREGTLESDRAEASEGQEEQLVEAVGEAAESPAEELASETPGLKRAAEEPKKDSKPVKKLKQDVPQPKEAPFQLMDPANPDVDEIM